MQSLRERADEARRCVHLSQAQKSQHKQDDHDKSYDVDDVVHLLLLGATAIKNDVRATLSLCRGCGATSVRGRT
jgi:hypothetical protein